VEQQGERAVGERVLRRIVAVYDAIVRPGLAFHEQQTLLERRPGARGKLAKRPGRNLLVRLRDFKTDVLQFLFDFAVPFTNNQAEQDIRMMKVKMNISSGFRTQSAATTFATLCSVLSTARKRGCNLLRTFSATPASLILALSG
jgi:transposase